MGIVDRLLGRQSEERAVGGMWNVEVDAAGTSLNEKNATHRGLVCIRDALRQHRGKHARRRVHP